jgi:hypothetical protein
VPRGTYVVAGRSEAFSCAPGPVGWRYASDVLDLVCDSAFRTARVQVAIGSAWVRGGRTVLDDGTPVLTWLTSADPSAQRNALADVVLAPSPGSLIALARRVAAPGESPAEQLLAGVGFEEPALGGLSMRLRVARAGAESHDGLLVEQWHVDDVDAGIRTVVHLAGDVVLWALRDGGAHDVPWEVELAELDSPPSLLA